jgi:sulfur carrier protein
LTLISTLGIVVHLLINGKDHDDLPDGLTVATLIAHLGLPERKIAVERNREVVPKSTYAETVLETNDVLEIIHFIGGG